MVCFRFWDIIKLVKHTSFPLLQPHPEIPPAQYLAFLSVKGYVWLTFARDVLAGPTHPLDAVCKMPSAHNTLCCSCLVAFPDSLWHHKLQHLRLPCPLSPRVWSNSCPLSPWCHPTFSSSVTPFPPACNLFQYQGLFKWVNSLALSFLHSPTLTSIHDYWKNYSLD